MAPTEYPIEIDPVFGCWAWTGALDDDGYGIAHRRGHPTQAHRAVYRELIGEIAPGHVLDHLCRRRACVNPRHLEPVTGSENHIRRAWRRRCRRARCPSGHDLGVHVMVTPEGGRLCRICQGPQV